MRPPRRASLHLALTGAGQGLILGLVLTVGAGGCSSSSEDGQADPSGSSPAAASSASSGLPEFHSDPTAEPSAGTNTATAATELVWGAAEQRDVEALAGEVMALFARPGVEAQTWWSDLEPFLSPTTRRDYVGVDPANVPVHEVTGPVVLVPLKTALVAIAHVPTDAGLYAVTLSRSAAAPAWVVERITPPEVDPD